MYTAQVQENSPALLADDIRRRLHSFVSPLLRDLDYRLDARLVRTFERALEAILVFRNRAMGLLLSELGSYILSPDKAPAGTKRLSNLLRSPRWNAKLIGRFLWDRASERLKELEACGETPLLLWDQSVLEKPESEKAEGLCAVRSTRAVRLKRIKPGFYNPPGGRPVFVPGFEWLALMLCGLSPESGPAQVATMQWWTRRGEYATDARSLQLKVLSFCAKEWKRRVIHVFDRGYAGHPWLSALLSWRARFVLRWPKHFKLQLRLLEGPPAQRRGEERRAWELARGKSSWDKKMLYDTHSKEQRTIGILALPVWHPLSMTPLWLVVGRSGGGREPWYLLTSEPVETKEEAWRIYFAYHRRWQVEMSFRYNKCELGMESPRLWSWENRLKLLAIVSLVYSFLLSLLRPDLHALVEQLLRRFCHRTGKRGRDVSAPLYRLRTALSRLLLSHPMSPPKLLERTSLQSSG
jgi:hypothetical protein